MTYSLEESSLWKVVYRIPFFCLNLHERIGFLTERAGLKTKPNRNNKNELDPFLADFPASKSFHIGSMISDSPSGHATYLGFFYFLQVIFSHSSSWDTNKPSCYLTGLMGRVPLVSISKSAQRFMTPRFI